MNIIKLQDMLRGVPDDALIGYVQNPQGQVPSYLALSELQRRKDTRAKYQTEQAPESSVAEDLGQQAQPPAPQTMLAGQPQMQMEDQGVAALPTGDMYQEQNFAGGGIIAFDDGGEVQRYASKGLVNLAPDFSTPEKPGFMQRFFGSSSNDLLEQERQRLLNKIKDPKNPYNDLDYQQLQEVESKLAGKTQPGGAMTVKEGQAVQKKYETDLLKPPPPKEEKPKEEAPKQEKPANPYGIDSGYKPRPETDAEEKMARFDKLYGEDPAKERLTKRLTKMEERAAREEAQSPWMAIARAGFKTMAGTSPFALTNIGAGAAEGIDYYAASQDRLAKMEEKRMDIDSRLAEAERAKKLAAVQYGVGSEEYAKKANDEYQLKKMQSIYEVEKYKELNPYKMYGQVAEIQSKKEAARDKYLKQAEYRTSSLYAGKTITKDMDAETKQKIKDAQVKMKELERKLDAEFPVPALPGQAAATTNTPGSRFNYVPGKGLMPL
jgi:hypothetical protein